jgi:peptide/nickel transport system permease protein
MLSEGRPYISTAWWVVTMPGIAIALTVMATNLLGDWLRVELDPKHRGM